MLYFESTNAGPFGQQVKVEAGETYTFKFALSNNAKAEVGVFNKDNRNPLSADVKFIEGEDKGRYAIWTYEITMPETIKDGKGAETDSAIVGLKFGGEKPYKGYLFDVELYKSSDTEKNNTEHITGIITI